VGRHQGKRVHGAATAREQVDRASADLVDDPVQVVGVLLQGGLRGGSALTLRSTPRGS
jgi:hypothetical protein